MHAEWNPLLAKIKTGMCVHRARRKRRMRCHRVPKPRDIVSSTPKKTAGEFDRVALKDEGKYSVREKKIYVTIWSDLHSTK